MNRPDLPSICERLRPIQVGVRADLDVSRHVFGSEPAYVVQDPITFKSHRFSVDDYQVFLAIRDDEPLKTTFDRLVKENRIANSQEEDFYRFVLHLNALGLLSLPLSDGKSHYQRFLRKTKASRQPTLMKLLFMRVPLVQPDPLLTRTASVAKLLFSRPAFVIWLVAVVSSVFIVASRWSEFWSPVSTVLAIQNLPILWTLLVVLKTIHEFGHAYACKRFGGHVPEMGAYLILGTPCAYVDATAAWSFPSKLQRIIVSLGGMYFESMAAVVAVFVWNVTAPGPLHSAAQYAVLLSTAVTIGFNANPLMKYDGYYVLSDLIEIPNLRSQSQREISLLLQRWLLRLERPATRMSPKRRVFLLLFGCLSKLYKVVIVFGIALTIAFKVPAIGVGIAGCYVLNSVRQTMSRVVHLVRSLPSRSQRVRTVLAISMITAGIAIIIAWVPVPLATRVHGVVGSEDELTIHAKSSGFLVECEVLDGNHLEADSVICRLENRALVEALETKCAEIDQLRIQMQQQLADHDSTAVAAAKRLKKVERDRLEFEKSVAQLVVRSPGDGVIDKADALTHRGHFVQQGEPVATVRRGGWVIRSLATATQLSASQPKSGDRVTVLLPHRPGHPLEGEIVRIAPTGSHVIETPALTHMGGGEIAVETNTHEANHPYFQIVVQLEKTEPNIRNGMTAWVRLPTPPIPIAVHFYRNGLNLLNRLRLSGS